MGSEIVLRTTRTMQKSVQVCPYNAQSGMKVYRGGEMHLLDPTTHAFVRDTARRSGLIKAGNNVLGGKLVPLLTLIVEKNRGPFPSAHLPVKQVTPSVLSQIWATLEIHLGVRDWPVPDFLLPIFRGVGTAGLATALVA